MSNKYLVPEHFMRLLSLILKRVIFFIVLLVLFVGILDYTELSFTSDEARHVLLKQIKIQTGRDVRIDGEVQLTISLSPKLLVERIHIRNIDGFGDEDFITVAKARVEVPLLPLMTGTFHLEDIAVDQAKINLIQKEDGSNNWSFDHLAMPTKIKSKAPKDSLKKQSGIDHVSLGVFRLTDVSILYKDESRDQILEKHFERLTIDIKDKSKPHAEVLGSVQGSLYDLSFESDALHKLASGQPWLLHGAGKIADSKINIEAGLQLIENTIDGKVDISVKNANLGLMLEKLGFIAGQDAATDEINIKTKLHGSDYTELYEQAEIELQLLRGHWTLASSESTRGKELTFNKISSFASWNKPVEFHLDGMIAGEVINLDFKTNRLMGFFDETQKLDIDLKSSIAGTEATIKGTLDLPIKTKQFQLDLTLKGKDLEKLNPIIDAELPPFNDFSLTGELLANKKGFVLKSTDASIGDSHLQASIVIDTTSPKPLWTVNLSSPQLQLKDFALDNLDLQQPDKAISKTPKHKINDKTALKSVRRLIDIVQSPKMHFDLNLKVDKVLSGEDVLGKARFQLHLRDNAVSLKDADVEIPGGRITASATFEVVDNEIIGNTELNIDKLDYGIVARMFKPGAKLDGLISTRVDLELGGSDFRRLLDHATGQIDVALWPKNTPQVKILDLWATNLYLILLPEIRKKESKINCLVGLMNLDDGAMKEELFAIDTTKLWIYGNINVDFEREHVNLSLFPRSKTARLFSLQTPIRAGGSFSDINMVVKPLDLAGTYISFITSPLHVPMRWVFGGKPPEDGSAICEQFFDREHVKKLKEELQRKQQEAVKELLDSDY